MHRKLWARLLSCVLALSVVLAAVPKPAQAVYYVVGDGGSYALMEYFRHRWPDGGYKIWTDYPQEFRAIISNGGNAFTNYSQRWVGMDYLIGKYGVQEPEDMGTNSADVLAQLNAARQAFDDAWSQYQETNKPYQPGGIGGATTPSSPDQPSGGMGSGSITNENGGLFVIHVDEFPSGDLTFDNGTVVTVPAEVATGFNKITPEPPAYFFMLRMAGSNANFTVDANAFVGYQGGRDYRLVVNPVFNAPISARWNAYAVAVNSSATIQYTYSRWTGYGVLNARGISGFSYAAESGYPDYWPSGFDYAYDIIRDAGKYLYVVTNMPVYVWGSAFNGDGGGSTGGMVNPVPDPSTIEKPESPVSPTNPQTPERDSPTIVIGGTTQTVPDPSPAPDLSTIEDLLRRILANTNTIIEQMNSFSSQLGQELADFYDMVYDWFARLDSWLDQLQAQMTRQLAWDNSFFDWLKAIDSDIQYLQSVCQNGFNDVTSWLQNIFNRMVQGNGGGSKPGIVDPADPSPVTDWLRQLWISFLADLQMVLPDQVGAVVDFLDQLRQKFPFSIPWDIAAMLALLNHAPVTPVIDIPWGYAGGIEYVHVDCHAWDDVVEIVRPMFLLLFALCLALLTRDLLAGLEAVL